MDKILLIAAILLTIVSALYAIAQIIMTRKKYYEDYIRLRSKRDNSHVTKLELLQQIDTLKKLITSLEETDYKVEVTEKIETVSKILKTLKDNASAKT